MIRSIRIAWILFLSFFTMGFRVETSAVEDNLRIHSFPPKLEDGAYPQHYRPERTADFIDMLLDVKVFMSEMRLDGAVHYRFRPIHDHVDYIRLDAFRMNIHNVKCSADAPFKWTYSDNALHLQFERTLAQDAEYELHVQYSVSKPSQGMYFSDSKRSDPQNPDQLYTLGEPIGFSDWCPAPDYPNDRLVTGMNVTVPNEFVTLSNGSLVKSNINGEWRTDSWRQEIPHVFYLVSLVVGKFDVVTDEWNGVDVQYYVERGLSDDARPSMGKTPDMIEFFSDYFSTPYPYEKYAQVAVRDFRAGGMEHTTATTLFEFAVIDKEARLDNDVDGLVAHELAHQWFGDYVTCEAWSHLWLNESFATFCDALWSQHAKGEDDYLLELRDNIMAYVGESHSYTRPIVSNQFKSPMEMFDAHTYPKGSVVLHMLRNQLGEELFRESLKNYLHQNAPGLVDTDDLMEAIESTSGKPMDRFFQQWVFRAGHPKVKVTHEWLPERKQVKVTIQQTQEMKEGDPAFVFPLRVDVITSDGPTSRTIQVSGKEESAFIDCASAPLSVVVDPNLGVLMELTHDKAEDMLLEDLKNGSNALVRFRAANALGALKTDKAISALKEAATAENHWRVQAEAVSALGRIQNRASLQALLSLTELEHPKVRRVVVESLGNFYKDRAAFDALKRAFQRDAGVRVRESAARALGRVKMPGTFDILRGGLNRPTYWEMVRRGALDALVTLEEPRAFPLLAEYAEDPYGKSLRTTAIRGLGRLGQKVDKYQDEALEELLRYLKSESDYIQEAAIDGLSALKNKDAIPYLQQLADSSNNSPLSFFASYQDIQERAKKAIEEINKDQNSNLSAENSRKILDMEQENKKMKERLEELESTLKKLQEEKKSSDN